MFWDVVGDGFEIIVDGGVWCGIDVLKVFVLGVIVCLIGCFYLFGLVVGGEVGVVCVLE